MGAAQRPASPADAVPAAGREVAVLAVDGGNSKTDVALLAADGTLLGAARVGPGSWHAVGMRRMVANIAEGRRLAAVRAGLTAEAAIAQAGVYCLAGADLPLDDARLLRALRRAGFADETMIRNDAFAGLRAGTGAGWGVSIVCGTGINCAGVGPDGRTVRFPSLGRLSGDEGGGGDLVVRAMAAAVRGRDGRGPRTKLSTLLPAAAGLRRPIDLITAIRRGRVTELDLVAMAPVVFEAARDGDAVARELVDWLADELVLMGTSTLRRLGLLTRPVDIVLSGSIWGTDDTAFHDRVRQGLLAAAPRATITRLDAPPVLGAALLGVDMLALGTRAGQRARETITHARLARSAIPG